MKRIHEGGAAEPPGQPHGMISCPGVTGKQDLDGIDPAYFPRRLLAKRALQDTAGLLQRWPAKP